MEINIDSYHCQTIVLEIMLAERLQFVLALVGSSKIVKNYIIRRRQEI